MELRRVTFGKKPGRCHRLRSNGRNPPHLPVGVLGPSEPEAPHTAARPGVNTPLVISYVDNNLAGVASVGGDNRRLDETMSIVTALCWDLPEHHVVWSSATIKLRGNHLRPPAAVHVHPSPQAPPHPEVSGEIPRGPRPESRATRRLLRKLNWAASVLLEGRLQWPITFTNIGSFCEVRGGGGRSNSCAR